MSDTRGSVWRKWDLHIHTRNDHKYTCLGPDSLSSEQLDRIIQDTGLTKAQITSQERQIDPDQYAKLFVSCVGLFTDLSVVAITNHNDATGIDEIMREAETNRLITILPGLEVSSSHGLHILCILLKLIS